MLSAPVREALIQLAAEGLIEIRPRRGAVVTSIGRRSRCPRSACATEVEMPPLETSACTLG